MSASADTAGPRLFTSVDDIRAAVGEHLGHSAWHTVTQAAVDQFAEATGDHQWIHVDPEAAATGPFGTTIAHGYLTLSLIPMLAHQVYDLQGFSLGLNYGADKVRFPTPVPVGSRVRAGVELTGLTPASVGHQMALTVTVEIEGAAKPACVAQVLYLVA